MTHTLQGAYTAIVTPFTEEGEIDLEALDRLIEAQVQGGITGIVPCGTTGESPTLSHDEHRIVIRRVVEKVAGRCQVMAGCGSNSTREAVGLTEYAAEIGATSTLQVCPYYNRPNQEGLFQHFKAIAEATDLPVVLYNIPGRTGVNLTPDTVVRLAEIDTIRAIKEATGSLDQASEILCRTDLAVLSGDDSLTLPLLAVGAHGVVSVTSNLVPSSIQELVSRFRTGDAAGALELHRKLFPLFKALFCDSNPVPVKFAFQALKSGTGYVRAPLTRLTPENQLRVRHVLAQFDMH